MFYCYSIKLRNFLMKNGHKYVAKDIHKKTNRTYWCFIGDESLNKSLDSYKSLK